MTLEGAFTFDGPRELVWDLLLDPAVLARAMPGTERLERVADGRYEGTMKVSIGPVTAAAFALAVEVRDPAPPERFTLHIDSRGQLGFTRGTADVVLAAESGAKTRMTYRAELQVGGRIAAVGQRVLDMAARMMTGKGLATLARELAARLAAGGAA